MNTWKTPVVEELNVALTADGNYNNVEEGISIPCTNLVTGEVIPDCENISNKKCAES